MRPGEYNLEVRSNRRLHTRFGFGPEADPEDLTGADFTGSVIVAGEETLDLDPFLTVYTDGDSNTWADLDIPAASVTVTETGRWELVINDETRLEGAAVYVESLS